MTASTAIFSSCGNNSFSAQIGVNHADTIYLGDLREKFKGDSLFFQVVAPDLMLIQNQYTWLATVKEAEKKGLDEKYYKKVQLEINRTNEAIRKGIMKGANAKRIYDFQKEFE
ncbi:MAG: hypothetical protein Q4D56_06045 [Bacteroides sp.]|nr:hypothetical protein [Bacteroides sp.]